jgi:hypothetical protein
MEENYNDYIDIAKENLSIKTNEKMEEYKKSNDSNTKKELMELLKDRQELFSFNKEVIKKYL